MTPKDHGSNEWLKEHISQQVASLDESQRRSFLSLHNIYAYKEDYEQFIGIIRTNALPIEDDDIGGGIFLDACRINHSCDNNSQKYWNNRIKQHTIHALRDIPKDEEITIYYLGIDSVREVRQRKLQEKFGFSCSCSVCSLPPAESRENDKRLTRIQCLDDLVEKECMEMNFSQTTLGYVDERIQLYEKQRSGDVGLTRAYFDAAQIASANGDLARGRIFLERAVEGWRVAQGSDSAEVIDFTSLARNPAKLPLYGISTKWKTSMDEVPSHLGPKDFEDWLWRRAQPSNMHQLEQFASLRDRKIFPDFSALPSSNHFSLLPRQDPGGVSPLSRHWCFLGEVSDSRTLHHLELELADVNGHKLPLHINTPGLGHEPAFAQVQKGHSVAVLYAANHTFMYGDPGINLENLQMFKSAVSKTAVSYAYTRQQRILLHTFFPTASVSRYSIAPARDLLGEHARVLTGMLRLLKSLPGGGFSLTSFDDEHPPPYAILSHTWEEGQEVTYDELLKGTGMHKSGYGKLHFCGERAAADGLEYFWVDTCCIDKATNDELSTAINSMFRWYQRADKCYVYLADVTVPQEVSHAEVYRISWEQSFRKSRWFTRGWTLQELLAPASVEFFSREGRRLGSRISLELEIHEITKISIHAMTGRKLSDFSVEERMSWAGGRETTKKEDKAYCLLGIFGIHMPLIYGEREEHAFLRLREEIQKRQQGITSTGKRRRSPSSPENNAAKRRRTEPDVIPYRGLPEANMETSYIPTVGARVQSGTSLTNEQKHSFLESLRFEQIDARQMTIKTAHAKTCKWLLKHPKYLEWLDPAKLHEHHGFLWIKGKAGAGKSTLMKSALIDARKRMKDRTMISFFFNARGEEFEKSTAGTYRSLLLQLLEQIPASQRIFESLEVPTSSLTSGYRWNVESLKSLLEQAVNALGRCSVVCFIDALDECEEDQVRDMIQFLERIGDVAVTSNNNFQVCLSSRHYPHITISNGIELVLEGQEGHAQDIANYIATELKIGNGKTAQEVRAELQEKASGIFMWVILVVAILNKEFDSGQIPTLRKKLQEIPSDLYELFRDIITRDSNDKDKLVLCIQWVLFSKQPLSPEELYHAIYSGVNSSIISELDTEDITTDDIKRFILHASKGLAEATVSTKSRVQFIHQSVQDFLLKKNGLGEIWPEYASNFDAQSHERLKKCCLNYISIDATTPLMIPEVLPKASSQPAAELRKAALQRFPLLEYAVLNVLYHADIAQGMGVSQGEFLSSFPLAPWIKLHNLLEKHEIRRHTKNASLLYMLAELNAANLITVHPSVESCLNIEDERYGCAFFAANATQSHKAMQVCIEFLGASQTMPDYTGGLCRREPEDVGTLHSLGRDFRYSKHKRISVYAMKIGSATVIRHLIAASRFDLQERDHSDTATLLCQAVERGASKEARLLLDAGANVNAQGGYYSNALQAALTYGYKDIVELLLDRGAHVNAQGGFYGNALQAASTKGHKDIVDLLLDRGADANAQGGFYGSALQAASTKGHKDIVWMLLDRGANIYTQDGRSALAAASGNGHKEVVELLQIHLALTSRT
ncbi:hypothetical protein ACEQ8H_007868 [Pleosporales sp. CAS-2024a]